jgi:hypothetical protein
VRRGAEEAQAIDGFFVTIALQKFRGRADGIAA